MLLSSKQKLKELMKYLLMQHFKWVHNVVFFEHKPMIRALRYWRTNFPENHRMAPTVFKPGTRFCVRECAVEHSVIWCERDRVICRRTRSHCSIICNWSLSVADGRRSVVARSTAERSVRVSPRWLYVVSCFARRHGRTCETQSRYKSARDTNKRF